MLDPQLKNELLFSRSEMIRWKLCPRTLFWWTAGENGWRGRVGISLRKHVALWRSDDLPALNIFKWYKNLESLRDHNHDIFWGSTVRKRMFLDWFNSRKKPARSMDRLRENIHRKPWNWLGFPIISGWWFGTFFYPYIGNNHPNWLSYFSEGWPNHQPDLVGCVPFKPGSLIARSQTW